MAIKNINATHRQAMLLHCQGVSIEEIAETINRSPGTVENWCQHGFKIPDWKCGQNLVLKTVIKSL